MARVCVCVCGEFGRVLLRFRNVGCLSSSPARVCVCVFSLFIYVSTSLFLSLPLLVSHFQVFVYFDFCSCFVLAFSNQPRVRGGRSFWRDISHAQIQFWFIARERNPHRHSQSVYYSLIGRKRTSAGNIFDESFPSAADAKKQSYLT